MYSVITLSAIRFLILTNFLQVHTFNRGPVLKLLPRVPFQTLSIILFVSTCFGRRLTLLFFPVHYSFFIIRLLVRSASVRSIFQSRNLNSIFYNIYEFLMIIIPSVIQFPSIIFICINSETGSIFCLWCSCLIVLCWYVTHVTCSCLLPCWCENWFLISSHINNLIFSRSSVELFYSFILLNAHTWTLL